MGIMQNKVTRRVALGSIAGGLAGTVAVIQALKGRYEVNMPTNHGKQWGYTVGGPKTVHVYDRDIGPIEMPKMTINSAEDLEKYNKLTSKVIQEAVYKKLDRCTEKERQALVAEFVENKIKSWQAQIDNIESRSLWDLLSETVDDSQKGQLRDAIAKMSEADKSRLKAQGKKLLTDSLAKWKSGGEGRTDFEQHTYEELFHPPKPLTEKQQLQVDKQVTKQRLEELRNGTFEKMVKKSFEANYSRLVQSGKLSPDQAKQAVIRSTSSAVRKEQMWAQTLANAF